MLKEKDFELALCISAQPWRDIVRAVALADSQKVRSIAPDAELVEMAYWPARELLPLSFRERRECEDDPSLRQIIPYTVVRVVQTTENGVPIEDGILVYRRGGGGEVRLDDKYSIGIGGHTNPVDTIISDDNATDFTCKLAVAVHECRWREIYEELPEWLWEHVERPGEIIAGPLLWIDDRSDKVGSVHLGLLTIITIELENDEEWETVCREVKLDAGIGKVMSLAEAAELAPKMETWSAHILPTVEKMFQTLNQ